MCKKYFFYSVVVFSLNIARVEVSLAEYQHSPDPLIFDGSQLPPEKQPISSLAKIIQKRPRIGIPSQYNSKGKQQKNQGVDGIEGPQHKTAEEKEGIRDQMKKKDSGSAGESEMVHKKSEGAVGGDLAEADETVLFESEDMESIDAGGEKLREKEQGHMSLTESAKDRPEEMGNSSSSSILSHIAFGAPSEMIEAVEMGNNGSDTMVKATESTETKKPMIGKNKGQSLGMEEGDRIPSDI